MQKNKNLIEDEIDLRELFQIIWNKRMLIIFFTLFITIISGVYIYSKPSIYEVKSYVEIGFIDKEILEDSNTLEQKLRVIFSIDDFNIELNSLENGIVSSIRQIKNVKNLLEIKTEAYSNEVAVTKNKEVLNYLQNLYEPKIEQYKVILNNNILDTKREIDYIQEKIKSIYEKIILNTDSLNNYTKEVNKLNKILESDKSSSSSLVISIQLLNNQNLIANTQNEIKDLELKIIELKTKTTQLNEKIEILSFKKSEQNLSNMKLVGEYILNNNPIRPKKSLTITVSFVTGFIVSIFLVFLLNFINNSRKEP
ncbi:MAG: GNVR domain-containing protein [Arcobacteraceae bacterium]